MSGYGPDLAHVHDTGFGDFARDAAPGLLARLRATGIDDGLVVDLGCGSGIWAAELLASGYDVLGIDLSDDLLAIARTRAPGADLRRGSIYDAELPPCRAVTALGEILSYGFDPRAGRDAATALLRRVHAVLEPGGLLLFDVVAPGREPPGGRRTFAEGDGWLLALDAAQRGGVLTRRITTFRAREGAWRRTDEEHTLWTWEPEQVAADLASAGFTEVERVPGYGGAHRFPPGWAGFSARRRPARA